MNKRIDARRAAVLVLDVQNDLVKITPGIKENRVLENIAAVIAAARRKRVPVIHITASVRADFLDIPQDNPLWDGLRKSRQLIFGTRGAAIILTGLWTNWVVESTARHASDMGSRVFIARECVASNTAENHDFAINRILPTICYVVNTNEVLAALK